MAEESKNFKKASVITPVDSHTYQALSTKTWANNGITQGGIALGIITTAVRTHFRSTHPQLDQPHSLSIHASMLRPTPVGVLTIKIVDTKIGRGMSTVHVSLLNSKGEATIVAYVLQGNFDNLSGVTEDTKMMEMLPRLPPKTDRQTMLSGNDPNWVVTDEYARRSKIPFLSFHDMFEPRAGMSSPACGDRWIASKDEIGGWTNSLLGHLADLPYVPAMTEHALGKWIATLTFTIDFKKALPEDGVIWLLVRTSVHSCRDGKLDYNSVIVDEDGEVVALATQIMRLIDPMRRSGSSGKSRI